MATKYERCKKEVKKKIKDGKIKKTYKCDSSGKANNRGKHKCKTSEFKISIN